jgi:1-deoxy-D-xylulose-5-phosphate synthase
LAKILPTINAPADIRKLTLAELDQLAVEIRELIIATVAENGGHLAPNLGVVELTLALHYVFNTPHDKLIWDVGHQSYAHKIITGRRDSFASIRCEGGISGYCSREESEYDCFSTGHSSNSVSLALGMAEARDLCGEQHKVVAVIGDGAMTGGVALEALNHAGDLKTPFLIILNDNEMSINHNVGALDAYLSHIRSDPRYGKAKEEVHGFLDHIPWLGPRLANLISGLKGSLKSLLVPGMFFEDLGFTYLGPTDGHNIASLVDMLRRAAVVKKPVLLHVLTTKGKGYAPAEQSPGNWHSVMPFEVESSLARHCPCSPTYTDIFGKTIVEIAAQNEDIVAITAAMTDGTGLTEFRQRFPGRFYDVGIAEQHAVTFAAGLANAGKKPVVAIYSSFIQRAYDQVIEDLCLQKLPVVLALDRAGIVSGDGYTHQGIFDLSFLSTIPGLTIMAPADGAELTAMLRFAFDLGAPAAIRYPKAQAVDLPFIHAPLRLGEAEILRDGQDMAFFAIGSLVSLALAAAELLSNKGIAARVVNARFAAPLATAALLDCAAECQGRIISVEENVLPGGFGSSCRMALAATPVELLNAGLPHGFIAHGKRECQLKSMGMSAEALAQLALTKWFTSR